MSKLVKDEITQFSSDEEQQQHKRKRKQQPPVAVDAADEIRDFSEDDKDVHKTPKKKKSLTIEPPPPLPKKKRKTKLEIERVDSEETAKILPSTSKMSFDSEDDEKNTEDKPSAGAKAAKKPRKPVDIYEAKSVSKSDGVKVIQEQWYDAFYPSVKNKFLPKHDTALVVLSDDIQAIKCFGSTYNTDATKPELYTERMFEDLTRGMRKSAENTLERSNVCYIYGMILDKYMDVPISKGVEQTKRTMANNTFFLDPATGQQVQMAPEEDTKHIVPPADKISYKDRRPYLKPGAPIPTDWNLAKHDRKDTLPHLIRCICRAILNPHDEANRFNLPPGRRVFIDGHAMMLEDIIENGRVYPTRDVALSRGIQQQQSFDWLSRDYWHQNGYKTDDDVYHTPICFEHVMDDEGSNFCTAYFLPTFRNTAGEADFSIFTAHRNVCRLLAQEAVNEKVEGVILPPQLVPMVSVDILSIDSDMVYLGLLYLDKLRRESHENVVSKCQIWLRYQPQLGWVFGREFVNPQHTAWAHINHLYKLIEIDAKFPPGIDQPLSGELLKSNDDESSSSKTEVTSVKVTPSFEEKEKEKEGGKSPAKKASKPKPRPKMITDQQMLDKYSHDFKTFISYRTWAVVLTMLAGGGDYTHGYRSVTHEKMFLALKQNARYIGDLVQLIDDENRADKYAGEFVLDGAAYAKMVKCAYMLSKGSLHELEPATTTLEHIQAQTAKLVPANQPPEFRMVEKSMLHLSHYLALLNQLGESRVVEPLNFEKYGFKKVDPEKPWGSSNIIRLVV